MPSDCIYYINLDGPLFPRRANYKDRFRKIFKQFSRIMWGIWRASYDIDELGTHIICPKGEKTYAFRGGSTTSPLSVAINNNGGWTLGTVRHLYMMYDEKAFDHFVGRIFAGLPILSTWFAVSAPDFWVKCPCNHENAISDQLILDEKVLVRLWALFSDLLCRQNVLIPFLQVSLACACVESYGESTKSEKDKSSSMLLTEVYRESNDIAALSYQVVVL